MASPGKNILSKAWKVELKFSGKGRASGRRTNLSKDPEVWEEVKSA